MDERGVFAVARSIWEHDAFQPEPFTQREAWMWLVGAAAWKPVRIRGNAKRGMELRRGEFTFATRFLGQKWGWSKSRVDRFLCALENRDMLRDASRDGVKVYSISNYNDFQVVGLPSGTNSGTENGTRAGHERDKEETLKHSISSLRSDKPTKPDAPASEPLPDWLDREAWAAFLDMRRRKRAPVTARATAILLKKLGGWRAKGHDPTAILDASTAGAWTGLYEPKDDKNGKHAPTAHDNILAGTADLIREYTAAGEGDDCAEIGGPGIALLPPELQRRAG